MSVNGIHHVGISTPDIDRLIAFYCDVVGFEAVASAEWSGSKEIDRVLDLPRSAGAMALLRLGDAHVEVFQFDPPPEVSGDRLVSAPGINHICLAVDDVRAEMERMAAAGMRFHSDPVDIGDGLFTYGRDPDGNVIELWQTQSEED